MSGVVAPRLRQRACCNGRVKKRIASFPCYTRVNERYSFAAGCEVSLFIGQIESFWTLELEASGGILVVLYPIFIGYKIAYIADILIIKLVRNFK